MKVYGKDFFIDNKLVYNMSNCNFQKAKYIVTINNYPNCDKAYCFRSLKNALKLYQNNKYSKLYENYKNNWYASLYDNISENTALDYIVNIND